MPLSTAQLSRQAAATQEFRDAVRAVHAVPRGDLGEEPWIPVIAADGQVTSRNLRQVLLEAHQLRDLAEGHPLARAAMWRWLTAVAAYLVRLHKVKAEALTNAFEADAGFTDGQVQQVMDALSGHLWLLHPTAPFLQSAALLDALKDPLGAQTPVYEAVPHLPNPSSAGWFVKNGEPGLRGGLPAAVMARWLVTRWHYQLPGNGPAVVRGGDPVTSQLGGVFSEGFQTITQAWRHDRRSMFRTLVANLSVDLVTAGTDDAAVGPAWLDPQQPQLRHFADPLYQATVTTTAALISRLDAGQATHLLRGSPPAQPRKHEGTDLDAQTRDRVRDADRHRLVRLAPKRGRSGAPGSVELRVLRLNPSVVWGELLRQVLHDGLAGGWRGVVDQSTLLVSGSPQVGETDLELLLASKNGSMTSPGWEAVATARLPLAAFTPPADRVPAISSLAEVAFSDQRGLYRRLGSAVAQLLAKNGEDRADLSREPAKSAAESVRGHWLVAAEDLLRAAIAGDAQVDEDWVQRLQYTALDAFDTFAAPYATSARYAGPYARACALLQPFPAKRNPA